MRDGEIRARFDGRARVELRPGHAAASKQRRIEEIAHALGYRLLAVQNFGFAGVGSSTNAMTPRTHAAAPS